MIRRVVTILCFWIITIACSAQNNSGYANGYYKLFISPTFYHDAVHSILYADSLPSSNREVLLKESVDKALMNIYINRPDLVRNTETNINKTGRIISNDTTEKRAAKGIYEDFVFDNVYTLASESTTSDAPFDVVIKKPNFWTFRQDYYLQILQNFFSDNWYKGGERSYSMLAQATIEANYNNKQKVKWDNKLELKFGLQTQESDSLHKYRTSDDLIRLTSKLGLQASKQWYYTFQMIARTQFAAGVKSNDHFIYSDFMSPFELDLSVGMDYTISSKKKLKDNKTAVLSGSLNLSPLAYNFKYVGREGLETRYGIEEGHHTMQGFGSSLTLNMKYQPLQQFYVETRLWAYTSYKNVQAEWENTFSYQFSKYIAAKLFLYPRFDDCVARDEEYGYFQFREYTSLGLSFTF